MPVPPSPNPRSTPRSSLPRTVGRLVLGAFLMLAGILHLTTARAEFRAQVPAWVPVEEDLVVLVSGVVEIALGAALIVLVRHRAVVGLIVAAFFVAIFPGNLAQYVEGVDAFGLDTERARLTRLFFQPVLVLWALWACGSWSLRRRGERSDGV